MSGRFPNVLGEFLAASKLDSGAAARRLGLVREQQAIASRYSRVASAWASHLATSRAAVMEGAGRCSNRRYALVIGAGDGRDVPVGELAAMFELTVLADIVVSPAACDLARRYAGRVLCLPWDATGTLRELALRHQTISAREVISLFENAEPERLPYDEPDLVVSANCLSQLGLIPTASLAAVKDDASLTERCAQLAARRHLRWLAQRSGVRVLIGDTARLDIGPDGRVLKREDLVGHLHLRSPGRTWRWNLAPIPELSRTFHRVHTVGAWIFPPYITSVELPGLIPVASPHGTPMAPCQTSGGRS